MDEARIAQILKRGFPSTDVSFRMNLLKECLAVLAKADEEMHELGDDNLDMLAAAGDIYASDTDEPRD